MTEIWYTTDGIYMLYTENEELAKEVLRMDKSCKKVMDYSKPVKGSRKKRIRGYQISFPRKLLENVRDLVKRWG